MGIHAEVIIVIIVIIIMMVFSDHRVIFFFKKSLGESYVKIIDWWQHSRFSVVAAIVARTSVGVTMANEVGIGGVGSDGVGSAIVTIG